MTVLQAGIEVRRTELPASKEAEKLARLEVRWADLQFTAEGEPHWVAQQLDKVLTSLSLQEAEVRREDDRVMATILG